GEWGGAVLMATEHAPKGKAGLYGVAPQLGVPAGVILANGVFLVCTQLTSEEQFLAWGWRVPFLLSFVLVFIAMWIRLGVMESPAFQAVANGREVARVPLLEVLTTSWRTVLLAGGTFIATHGIANVFMVFALSYGTEGLGYSRATMLTLLIGACPFWMLGMTLSAYWSDVVGRRRVYVVAAVALVVVSAFFFTLFDTGSVPLMQVAMIMLALVMGATVGPQSALFSELFPAHVRYSGASLAYQIGAILGGGIAPFVATWLYSDYGTTQAITGYFLVVGTLSLACTVVLLRGTRLLDLAADAAPVLEPGPAAGPDLAITERGR
ncbi:MAG: MFS transporter, partial [Actinomycetota bacterium]|nr:MFS transporter [Actinomycetota bacterium]